MNNTNEIGRKPHQKYAMFLKNGIALDLDLDVPRQSAIEPAVTGYAYKGTIYEWTREPLKKLAQYASLRVIAAGDEAWRKDIAEYGTICDLADGLLSDTPFQFLDNCKTLDDKLKTARAEYRASKK